MKAIDLKGKVRFILTVLVAIIIANGLIYAQDKSDNKDNAYNKVAKDLTNRLSKRVNLTKDQFSKVQDILVDYQKDIADKWSDKSASVDNTGNKKDITEDYRDADKKANDKIEKALSGNEVTSYMSAKKDWWAKIKDRVYSKEFMDVVNYREEDEDNAVGSNRRDADNEKNADRNKNISDNRSDRDNNKSGNITDKDQDSKFEPFAKEMATELMQKLNLSLQQAADIQDALIDYQKSIADVRNKEYNDSRRDDNNVRVADNRNADNRRENVVGSRNTRNERMEEFRDIDNSANDKIVNVLEDNQKAKYDRAKKQWWKEVKDKVYASIQRENRNISSKETK